MVLGALVEYCLDIFVLYYFKNKILMPRIPALVSGVLVLRPNPGMLRVCAENFRCSYSFASVIV